MSKQWTFTATNTTTIVEDTLEEAKEALIKILDKHKENALKDLEDNWLKDYKIDRDGI